MNDETSSPMLTLSLPVEAVRVLVQLVAKTPMPLEMSLPIYQGLSIALAEAGAEPAPALRPLAAE
jgi:hypothetical protein